MKITKRTLKQIILQESMAVLHEKQGKNKARYQKELNLIKKDPKAYIQQRTAKLQKKVGKAGKAGKGGAGGGEVKDVLLTKMKDEAGDQKQDVQKLKQVNQLGDKVVAQAQKDPAQKPHMQKLVTADKAVHWMIDLVDSIQKKIFGEFKAASKVGDMAKMKEKYDYYVKFGKFSDKFIDEAFEAMKKGKEDPKQYDEVIAMAKKYGFEG